MKKVCILDYGSGNVASVYNLIKFLKFKCIISNQVSEIKNSSHIILPGVGAFGESIKKIRNRLPLEILEKEILLKKRPFLGICVGMQVLAEKGEEFGSHKGLGWIKGKVIKLKAKTLPHIGWNNLLIKKKESSIIQGINNTDDFYFVNSFHFDVKENKSIISKTSYTQSFCSIVQKNNIIGVQFHPEKSQDSGKKLLINFLNL